MLAEGDRPSLITAGFDACYPWPMFQMMKKVASGERPATALDTVMATQTVIFQEEHCNFIFTSNHDERIAGISRLWNFSRGSACSFCHLCTNNEKCPSADL
jgi:hypothetical protein